MKRKILSILILCLVLLSSACASSGVKEPEKPSEPTVPATPASTPTSDTQPTSVPETQAPSNETESQHRRKQNRF